MVFSVSTHRFHSEQSTFPSLPCWDFPQELEWLCVVRIGAREYVVRNIIITGQGAILSQQMSCCTKSLLFSGLQHSSEMFHVSMHITSEYLHKTRPPTALRFGSSHFSTHLVFYTPALGSSILTTLIPHLSPKLCKKQSDPSLFG